MFGCPSEMCNPQTKIFSISILYIHILYIYIYSYIYIYICQSQGHSTKRGPNTWACERNHVRNKVKFCKTAAILGVCLLGFKFEIYVKSNWLIGHQKQEQMCCTNRSIGLNIFTLDWNPDSSSLLLFRISLPGTNQPPHFNLFPTIGA